MQELECMLEIAREAAAVVNAVYVTEFGVDYKSPLDPVTDADRRANALICERLSASFPGVPIVAEESDPATFADFRAANRVFFVDPLDGTREFVDRNGEFVVMIGLLEGERPTAGVMHAPATGTSWLARQGYGAWYVDADGERHPLGVSETASLGAARILSTRSHKSAELEQALAALGAARVDALGSAGLKCAQVAAGNAEAYVATARAGSRWDLCAGQAIIEVAGGKLTDAFGDAIDYRSESLVNARGIIASNARLHGAIVARLAEARSV